MRATPDSTGNTTPDDTQPDDNRQLRWLERLSAYRQPIGLLFTLLLFSAGLFACWHLLHELDPDALRSAIAEVPASSLLAACWRPSGQPPSGSSHSLATSGPAAV